MSAAVREAVAAVLDPELPMVTIEDLGILRDVRVDGDVVHVTITPTYAGCPAMDAIRADIEAAVPDHPVVVHTVLSPAWSTDDITEAGRSKLGAGGIAPPGVGTRTFVALTVRCPQCGSPDTRELSRFGSTACKALWVCNACAEPFDRFKEL
ncbi:MAG TPA: 1,2-phenylacetyl-CoA epoxidase subunit PaaD [Marmoricola sp.]|nr:1,2-phenylacetyl-CoA epoxidase subunit PaaD [Marmoricola sp.]